MKVAADMKRGRGNKMNLFLALTKLTLYIEKDDGVMETPLRTNNLMDTFNIQINKTLATRCYCMKYGTTEAVSPILTKRF